jgi:outer membrane protein insertion porin family
VNRTFFCGFLLLTLLASTPSEAAPHPRTRQSHKKKDDTPADPSVQAKLTEDKGAHTEAIAPFLGKNVGKIDITGLKKIEKDAAIAKLTTKVESPLTAENVRADMQGLFSMGYFDDISVQAEKDGEKVNLSYAVHERPVIAEIKFEGNERIGTSDLQDVVKVKQWSILDLTKVREDTVLIQKHYEEKGYYLAKVGFEIQQTKPEEVTLVYKINDYDKVQIKKIIFLNNKRFSDDQLKSVFQETREGGLFSFISSSGNFKESAFKTDLQRLTYFYLDHGYVKFRYENPVVTVSDDKKWLYISIYVDEGDPYKIGTIDFSGDLLFSKEELHKSLTLNPDETFGITKRNNDIQRLTEKYQDLGYAFVNVIPKMQMHDDTKTTDIEYSFEKGHLAYFGEINVTGNTKTHDKVIRRELKIHEGELYNGTNLRVSKENVERLGYFQPGEVLFNSVTPKGKPDTVNIDIVVKERSTGTITLGAGYGSVQKFFFTSTISEINLFGRGQTMSFSAQYSADRIQRSFNLGFTDPYAFDTRWTAGGDLYQIVTLIPNKYFTRKLGFDVRAGYPLAEYINGYVTYKNENLNVLDNGINPIQLDDLHADSGILSSVIWSVVRDKRNNRFETTEGNYQSASLETAGLGGAKDFVKWDLNNRYYHKLIGDLVFRNSTEVGEIVATADKPLPPSEKFYLGGPNNMKGYGLFMLGPSRPETDDQNNPYQEPLGGVFQAFSLFELEYPLLREAGLKWVVFYDIGNAWDHIPTPDYLVVRSDAGVGIRWFSPIGPLRFEWGWPFKPRGGEGMQFNFFIGPPF